MIVVELKNNLSVKELGGKGYSLGILTRNNFDVPKGFVVISEAFFKFLRDNNLMENIEKLASEIDKGNFQERSEEIKNLILNGKMPEEIVSEINESLIKLNLQYVSIRSSAVSEDSLKASFAGLHDTFLNVKAEQNSVLENVKKCWTSLFNERAVIYRIKKKISHLEGMAVIVQEMIPAEIAGTAFTAHPDTKDRNVIIIEATWGLGESLVSGSVTPDLYIIDKKSFKIIKKTVGRKKTMTVPSSKGIEKIRTPDNKTFEFCLDEEAVIRLAKTCLEIEKVFEYPQDIEWCMKEGKIFILQSRSITSLGGEEYEDK